MDQYVLTWKSLQVASMIQSKLAGILSASALRFKDL